MKTLANLHKSHQQMQKDVNVTTSQTFHGLVGWNSNNQSREVGNKSIQCIVIYLKKT